MCVSFLFWASRLPLFTAMRPLQSTLCSTLSNVQVPDCSIANAFTKSRPVQVHLFTLKQINRRKSFTDHFYHCFHNLFSIFCNWGWLSTVHQRRSKYKGNWLQENTNCCSKQIPTGQKLGQAAVFRIFDPKTRKCFKRCPKQLLWQECGILQICWMCEV